MFYILLIIALVIWAWFFYTNRRATMEVTGSIVGTTTAACVAAAKVAKAKANEVKAQNDYEAFISEKVYNTSVKAHYRETLVKLDREFSINQSISSSKAKEKEYLALLEAAIAAKNPTPTTTATKE